MENLYSPHICADEHEYASTLKRMQEAVKGMLGQLDERERRIIISRFGLGGASEQTLEQLGRELGITKERVRQIESRAQSKLRRIASEEKPSCRASRADTTTRRQRFDRVSGNLDPMQGLPARGSAFLLPIVPDGRRLRGSRWSFSASTADGFPLPSAADWHGMIA